MADTDSDYRCGGGEKAGSNLKNAECRIVEADYRATSGSTSEPAIRASQHHVALVSVTDPDDRATGDPEGLRGTPVPHGNLDQS
jgi:hypothetical protein